MEPVQFAAFMGNVNDNTQDHSKPRNRLEIETLRRAADLSYVTSRARHCTKHVIRMILVNLETMSPVGSVL